MATKIAFSQAFDKVGRGMLHLNPRHVQEAVEKHTSADEIRLGSEMRIVIFLKANFSPATGHHLLIHAVERADTIHVHDGLRVKNDLGPGIAEARPAEVLRRLAERFGHEIVIGKEQRRFYLNDKVRASDNPFESVGRIIGMPPVETMLNALYAQRVEEEDGAYVLCALGYAIDLPSYVAWLGV